MYDIDYIKSLCTSDTKKCMKCGKCSGACPAYEKMEFQPHQYVAMMHRGDFKKAFSNPDSLFACLSCMACSERCPRDVEPSKVIEALRNVYLRQQTKTNLKFEEVPCIAEDENVPQQLLMSAFRKFTK